jgi:hypothetical protein
MAVLTAHTSFGGIDAETGETREAGATTVTSNLGAEVISDGTLGEEYSVQSFSVERNGSNQYITDTSALKDTDLITIGDEGLKVEWSTLKSMGMAPSVAAAIQEANAAQSWHTQGIGDDDNAQRSDQRSEQRYTTHEDPMGILQDNLTDGVRHGDLSANVATRSQLLADTAAMVGADVEDAVSFMAHAALTGDFDTATLDRMGLSEDHARDQLSGIQAAIAEDVRGFLGDREFAQLQLWSQRYPEVAPAMVDTAVRHALGMGGRAEWVSLYAQLNDQYGGRL